MCALKHENPLFSEKFRFFSLSPRFVRIFVVGRELVEHEKGVVSSIPWSLAERCNCPNRRVTIASKLKPKPSPFQRGVCTMHKCKSNLFIFMGCAQSPLNSNGHNRRWNSNERKKKQNTEERKVDGRRKILHSNVNKRQNNRNKLQFETNYHFFLSLSTSFTVAWNKEHSSILMDYHGMNKINDRTTSSSHWKNNESIR